MGRRVEFLLGLWFVWYCAAFAVDFIKLFCCIVGLQVYMNV